jgi:hypothetical protein
MFTRYFLIIAIILFTSCSKDDDNDKTSTPTNQNQNPPAKTDAMTATVDNAAIGINQITAIGNTSSSTLSISGVDSTDGEQVVLSLNLSNDAGTINVPNTGGSGFVDNVAYNDGSISYAGQGKVTIDQHDKTNNTIKGSFDFQANYLSQSGPYYEVAGTFDLNYNEF